MWTVPGGRQWGDRHNLHITIRAMGVAPQPFVGSEASANPDEPKDGGPGLRTSWDETTVAKQPFVGKLGEVSTPSDEPRDETMMADDRRG